MLLPFAQQHLSAPLLDKQAEWCEVFERGRATSLLLFEHVHAESRDRGQAMVDLMSQYEKAGLELDCRELPDYLPLYLEYLSIVSDDEAREGLQNVAPILALIGGRLKQREVAHYQLFDALLSLAETRLSSDSVAKQVSGENVMIPVRRWTPCGKRNRSSLSKTTPHRATVRRCSNINDALARRRAAVRGRQRRRPKMTHYLNVFSMTFIRTSAPPSSSSAVGCATTMGSTPAGVIKPDAQQARDELGFEPVSYWDSGDLLRAPVRHVNPHWMYARFYPSRLNSS